MTGFIGKLFNRKPKAETVEELQKPQKKAESVRPPKPQKPQKPEVYYFLDADEAKTFGNLEYMRSSKSIRRTFPKTKLGKDNESIRQVSAMEMQRLSNTNGTAAPSAANGAMTQPTSDSAAKINERRRADTSLDPFRSMAREIRKS
ncbi:MAG: hypothetical protein IGS50_09410 [Synechococcales cyanobacterium C42_A2020_086]|nr:hypothetical protein [Synechococcales cyanobacterium C42_A2020_086]